MNPSPTPADLWMDLDETAGVLYLGGHLDRRGCAHLAETVVECLCRTPSVHVVDLRQVDVLGAAAIRLIDRVRHVVAAHGECLEIVCRAGTPARAALVSVGMGPHLVGVPAA
jgi:anti-anti-sigma regulatory factor